LAEHGADADDQAVVGAAAEGKRGDCAAAVDDVQPVDVRPGRHNERDRTLGLSPVCDPAQGGA